MDSGGVGRENPATMALADPDIAFKLARGVSRAFEQLGFGTLTEVPLGSGRRADVMAINDKGETVIVEIKSCLVDFRTDGKWHEYRDWCDQFYFAVATDFPRDLIPAECGLILADAYWAEIVREAASHPLHASRRRAQLIRFGMIASQRLRRIGDDIAERTEPQ
ncbi:MAG: MmcB family DNA repair protein [Dongiaceae bacterium]